MTNSTVSCLLALLILSLMPSMYGQQYCEGPQKGVYLSYNAQSKRDTLPGLFNEINTKIPKYNYTYNDGKGGNFVITNMLPQMYYNEHFQKETYVDPQCINVTLGYIELGFRFDYNISKGSGSKTGWARGRVHVDETSYFIKRLLVKIGFIEWDPVEVTNLTVTFPLSIEYSEPTLEFDDKSALELILNDHTGDQKLKSTFMTAFNDNYNLMLKQHLNKEDIIAISSFNYTYNNITIPFINAIKNYTIMNDQAAGLQSYFFFEPENKTTNCTADKIVFNKTDYGGVQEIYAISAFREALKSALNQGLLDGTLDKKWDVPSFQFYMGDLANSVPYAENFPSDDPFTVSCKWIRNNSNVIMTAYDFHEVYVQIEQVCTIIYNSKNVLEFTADISFVVRIVPEDDTLSFVILSANVFSPYFKSLDPNWQMKNPPLARFAITRVLEGFNQQLTFGTGWKTLKRKFPSTFVNKDYLIVFDPSEI